MMKKAVVRLPFLLNAKRKTLNANTRIQKWRRA